MEHGPLGLHVSRSRSGARSTLDIEFEVASKTCEKDNMVQLFWFLCLTSSAGRLRDIREGQLALWRPVTESRVEAICLRPSVPTCHKVSPGLNATESKTHQVQPQRTPQQPQPTRNVNIKPTLRMQRSTRSPKVSTIPGNVLPQTSHVVFGNCNVHRAARIHQGCRLETDLLERKVLKSRTTKHQMQSPRC